jgi:copper chaperone CopZ
MTCAFAVRGALKKFPGVESVDVSLNKGLASVKLKPGNTVLAEQLWDAVEKNGFTPKETHVVVRGEVLQSAGKLQLKVTGTNRTYDLVGAPKALELGGKTVTIEGTITPAKDVMTPVPIQVEKVRDGRR